MQRKGQQGLVAVEFAIAAAVFFTIVFSTFEAALLMSNEEVLTLAAIQGARTLATQRFVGSTPYTKATTAVRNKLIGNLRTATITLQLFYPCSGTCSCTSPYTASNGECVAPCPNDGTCYSNICVIVNGRCNTPPTGTMARASLVYPYTPLSTRFGFSNITQQTASMSEILQ